MREEVIRTFPHRLFDSDPDVRREMYLKLGQCKIRFDDIPNHDFKLLLLKEGLTDEDTKVREACSRFLKASIMSTETFEYTYSELKLKSNQIKQTQSVT